MMLISLCSGSVKSLTAAISKFDTTSTQVIWSLLTTDACCTDESLLSPATEAGDSVELTLTLMRSTQGCASCVISFMSQATH